MIKMHPRRAIAILGGACALLFGAVAFSTPAHAQVNCSGIAAWSGNSVVYAIGNLVTYEGTEYKVIQAHTSEPGWDPIDAPSLFSVVGACESTTGTCSTVPGAPGTPVAAGTTSTSTTLSWGSVTAPANCTISSYEVYKNGTALGSTTSTSYGATGLTASTTYKFTVAAVDADGTGAQSAAVTVVTSSASCAAVPSAPATPTASGTTSTSTSLSWGAVTPPANCSISSYEVYKNGTALASTTSTSYSATGLTASTTYKFTVAAVDSDGTGAQSASVSVVTSASGGEGPYGGTAAAIPGTVQAENYDTGGQGVGYNVTSVNGTANSYRTDGVDLEACTDTGGGYNVGWTAAGQWFRYTVNVATAGTYTAAFRVASSAGGGSLYIENSSGTDLTGVVTVPSTGGWQTWTTVNATLTLPAGQQVLTIYQDTAGFNLNYTTFSAAASCTATPSAPSTPTASGTTSSGTSLSWSAVTPPSGCSISSYEVYENGSALASTTSTSYSVTGLTASTTYKFTVAAVDSDGTGSQSGSVSVVTSSGGTTGTTTGGGPITNDLMGYWYNWGTITVYNMNPNYKVLMYSFAEGSGTDGASIYMYTPSATNPLSNAASDIAKAKANGTTVLLSLGGANSANITLQSTADVNTFVSTVESCVNTYGFQGIDLDLENSSVTVNAGDSLTNPTTPDLVYMGQALQQLKSHYGSSFIITMVPEVDDVDALDTYGGLWGSYMPLICANKSIVTFVDPQMYDTGSVMDQHGVQIGEGTADFNVAICENLLHSYVIYGGTQTWPGLANSQVGFAQLIGTDSASMAAASWNKLTQGTSDGGSYVMVGGPYPGMAGIVTWGANDDAAAGYSFESGVIGTATSLK